MLPYRVVLKDNLFGRFYYGICFPLVNTCNIHVCIHVCFIYIYIKSYTYVDQVNSIQYYRKWIRVKYPQSLGLTWKYFPNISQLYYFLISSSSPIKCKI